MPQCNFIDIRGDLITARTVEVSTFRISNLNERTKSGYIYVPHTDMGRITSKSNALNYHYLPKMSIELALPLLDFEKIMH